LFFLIFKIKQSIRPSQNVQVIRQSGPNQTVTTTTTNTTGGPGADSVTGPNQPSKTINQTVGAGSITTASIDPLQDRSSSGGGGGGGGGGGSGDSTNNGLTPEENSNVTKCKNFLVTLIQLAQRNEHANPRTVLNVKNLVQQLIDDKIQAEEFTERLQRELQSTPQVNKP